MQTRLGNLDYVELDPKGAPCGAPKPQRRAQRRQRASSWVADLEAYNAVGGALSRRGHCTFSGCACTSIITTFFCTFYLFTFIFYIDLITIR